MLVERIYRAHRVVQKRTNGPKRESSVRDGSVNEAFPGLEVPLQKDGVQVRGAADGEDHVGGVPLLHQGGNGLAQVQVVQVSGGHALRSGHARVDLHLQGTTSALKSNSGSLFSQHTNKGPADVWGHGRRITSVGDNLS